MTKKSPSKEQPERDKGPLEWVVFSISLVLVLMLLGYLIVMTVTWQAAPPDLKASALYEATPSGQHVYHVWLQNSGNETAENVRIEATLISAGKDEETAELDFQFSPKGSTREGWVSFSGSHVSTDSVRLRIESYKRP